MTNGGEQERELKEFYRLRREKTRAYQKRLPDLEKRVKDLEDKAG